MKIKIRRRCKCGCGGITNYGKKYIFNHHLFGNTYGKENKGNKRSEGTKRTISISMMGKTNAKGHKQSEETKKKRSVSMMGNTYGKGNKGSKRSEEHKLRSSISHIKCHPDDKYCDIWRDIEYRNNLREDYYYCENVDCKGNYNRLHNHHIDLNKKNCHPKNIMTLCDNCHTALHNKLRDGKRLSANPKDFLIINREDHIAYINKRTRKRITIRRKVI